MPGSAVIGSPPRTLPRSLPVPAAQLPAGRWWGDQDGVTTSHYNEFFPGHRLYAWGRGRGVGRGYDPGGCNRWIQIHFPSVDMSLTLGHLLGGSETRVGTTFTRDALGLPS